MTQTRWQQTMRQFQAAALDLYRAVREDPTEEGRRALIAHSQILSHVTQRALVPIIHVDTRGRVIGRSLR